jgi:hypothetical protein
VATGSKNKAGTLRVAGNIEGHYKDSMKLLGPIADMKIPDVQMMDALPVGTVIIQNGNNTRYYKVAEKGWSDNPTGAQRWSAGDFAPERNNTRLLTIPVQ